MFLAFNQSSFEHWTTKDLAIYIWGKTQQVLVSGARQGDIKSWCNALYVGRASLGMADDSSFNCCLPYKACNVG
jgi:hypothetical protein